MILNGRAIWARIWEDIRTYKWMAAAFLIYDAIVHLVTGAFCPMVILTGLPCPGCGITRAALFMLTGQFGRAMNANPTILLWIGFGFYFIIQRYVRGTRVKGAQAMLGIIAVIMIAVYGYRMAVIFPDRPPMSITNENILAKIFPAYREFLRGL